MTIKHLVFSGGAYKGLYFLGALEHLNNNKFLNIENIETIHAVSIGSIIAVILCLKITIKDIIEFIINKPLKHLFKFEMDNIININDEFGIYDKEIFTDMYYSFFGSVGLECSMTLKELYEYSGIELIVTAVRMNDWEVEDFSYKTHPDLSVLDATYMSSSLPFIIKPMKYNNSYYLDGGLINSYPLDRCIDCGYNTDEILSLKAWNENPNNLLKDNMNVFTFGWCILNNVLKKSQNDYYRKGNAKYELAIPVKLLNMDDAMNFVNSKESRIEMIKEGEDCAVKFLNEIKELCE
jgi:predicted acylesterase/phospholipase RssA